MRGIVFGALAVLVLANQGLAEAPLYVGILEGPQLKSGHRAPSITEQTHVRIAFQKIGAVWQPMASEFATPSALAAAHRAYPDAVNWTVVFDGRTLGRVASQSSGPLHWYADIGTHVLTTKTVPEIHEGAGDFFYGSQKAKVRPLLLVSAASDAASRRWDPQAWKPSPLTPQEHRLAVAALRSKVAMSERCDAPEQQPVHRIAYKDDAVTIVKSYRDNTGVVLFGVRLADKGANCGWFDDETFFDYWFVIDREQRVRFLDSQMVPVDAADLDNSGHSAWVFFTSRGEDHEGYALFYDNFEKKVQFGWSYH